MNLTNIYLNMDIRLEATTLVELFKVTYLLTRYQATSFDILMSSSGLHETLTQPSKLVFKVSSPTAFKIILN